MKYTFSLIMIFFLIVGASPALAADPMDDLKGPIEQVVNILKEPKYKDLEQKETQRVEIMTVIKQIFNFHEISKRTIGRSWKKFTGKQKRDFQETFADFLGYTYYKKVRDAYQGEQVVFLSQEIINERKAVVKTNIPRKNTEIPLDYRMIKGKNRWKIYDVIIEGVSLVKNYRTQFNKILRKESPDQLIARLKEKIIEQQKENNSPS